MPNYNWSKVKEIVDGAIRRKPDERAGYLDEVCVNDPDVRREVESLISSFEKADGFMEEPAVNLSSEAATVELHVLLAGQMIGRYEVVRKLGEGGMGAVYLAKDDKLGRNVAIKVLYKKYERYEENVRRFIREARAASALNHPNILTIHEIDEFEGSHYIVSEFVEGDTLREVLRKESLDLNRIIDITKQIAGALGAAHKARIIHRDIKPENVIVRDDGYVKVLDFGLAKLLRAEVSTLSFEGSGGNPNETSKGVILGTVSYMSPEQAQGTTVDERTDVFSLGVVLYEMIAGSTPFAGDSIAETFANVIKKEPPPLARFTSGLPDEMERIVAKMLSKDPELRYQTMGDCVADLKNVSIPLGHNLPITRTAEGEDQKTAISPRSTRDHRNKTAETSGIYAPWYRRWPGIAAIAVLLMATVGGGLYWFRPAGAKQTQIRSLAVLPLKSLDPNDNALGFGIADAVIRRISQTGEMTVRPASSVRQYLTLDADAITAGKQLAVDAVLDGTLQRVGDRLRIGVNLLKADGTSLWSDSFDIQMTDVFTVQDTISLQVASRLRVRLNAVQQSRLTKRSTSNPIAYEYFTKGIYSYDQREYGRDAKAQNDETIELFKKAIEADPNYALAHASLADAYAFQALHIVPGEQEKWISLAQDAINRADAIDPQLPETHLARAQVLFSDLSGYQAAAAIREVLAAQRLDPNIGHRDLAGLYNHIGLEDLAEREFQMAFEIDPTSEILAGEYVSYYNLLHRPDDYLIAHQKYFPEDPVPSLYYMMKGDLVTAKQRIDEAVARGQNRPLLSTSFLLALQGEKKGSEKLVARVLSDQNESDRRGTSYHHVTYSVACVYAINGNVRESMKWLRDSAERGNPSYTLFARDPFLDKIRQSPEFIEFMAELKLEYDKYRSEFH